jgi:GDP-4-dehydro-6-deoxy-D-mannose reductase
MSAANIEVTVDPALLRPDDPGVIVADASHLRARTGWQPHIAFDDTLRDILEDWRNREGNNP